MKNNVAQIVWDNLNDGTDYWNTINPFSEIVEDIVISYKDIIMRKLDPGIFV